MFSWPLAYFQIRLNGKAKKTWTDSFIYDYKTSSSRWLGNAGEDVADENRFHNV